jgi:hypothetical protein
MKRERSSRSIKTDNVCTMKSGISCYARWGRFYIRHFIRRERGREYLPTRRRARDARAGARRKAGGWRHGVPMSESAFSTTCNEEGLSVKQVRIQGDWPVVKERKSIVEHSFGTVKRAMDAGYCLCKGKGTVSGEFALTFLACNLKRAINIMGTEKLLKAFA